MKVQTKSIAIALLLLSNVAWGQKNLNYDFCKEFNAAEKMLSISLRYENAYRDVFLSEAHKCVESALTDFEKIKPKLKGKLTEKEITELEGCIKFIETKSLNGINEENHDGEKIMLWMYLTDTRLKTVFAKIMQ